MKPRTMLAVLATAGLLTLGADAARAQDNLAVGIHLGPAGRPSVDLAFFHNDLAPYGRWVDNPVYGSVFVPRVSTGWRPYSRGHWVYTDYGWTWISSERFGWATYHYGRWVFDPVNGWTWVPGTRWAAAYVDWHYGDNYVGWAPLPPTVSFDSGYVPSSYDYAADLSPAAYVFVPANNFLAVDVSGYALPPDQAYAIYPRTRDYSSYQWRNDGYFNGGIPLNTVQRFAPQPIPRYQLATLRQPDLQPRITGNQLGLFRPVVQAAAGARTAEWIAAQSRRNPTFRQPVQRAVSVLNQQYRSARLGQLPAPAANRQMRAQAQAAQADSAAQMRASRRLTVAQRQQQASSQRAQALTQRSQLRGQARAQQLQGQQQQRALSRSLQRQQLRTNQMQARQQARAQQLQYRQHAQQQQLHANQMQARQQARAQQLQYRQHAQQQQVRANQMQARQQARAQQMQYRQHAQQQQLRANQMQARQQARAQQMQYRQQPQRPQARVAQMQARQSQARQRQQAQAMPQRQQAQAQRQQAQAQRQQAQQQAQQQGRRRRGNGGGGL